MPSMGSWYGCDMHVFHMLIDVRSDRAHAELSHSLLHVAWKFLKTCSHPQLVTDRLVGQEMDGCVQKVWAPILAPLVLFKVFNVTGFEFESQKFHRVVRLCVSQM